MEQLNESDKDRLVSFINQNELDYDIYEDIVTKFNVTSYDGLNFYFYTFNEQYIIVKYDRKKDNGAPGSQCYEYFYFQNLPQVLEQLSFYDNSLHKSYWSYVISSLDVVFDSYNYNDDWYQDFIKDEHWSVVEHDSYKVIAYENSNYKPELKSPYNTLHEVSELNDLAYTKVDRLYFEIHPLSCKEKNESYLLKLSSSDDKVFTDWINYRVSKKKGLRLLIENLFTSLEAFKN